MIFLPDTILQLERELLTKLKENRQLFFAEHSDVFVSFFFITFQPEWANSRSIFNPFTFLYWVDLNWIKDNYNEMS